MLAGEQKAVNRQLPGLNRRLTVLANEYLMLRKALDWPNIILNCSIGLRGSKYTVTRSFQVSTFVGPTTFNSFRTGRFFSKPKDTKRTTIEVEP